MSARVLFGDRVGGFAFGAALVAGGLGVACSGGNNEQLRARDRTPDAASDGSKDGGGGTGRDAGSVADASGFVDGSMPDQAAPEVDAGPRARVVTFLHAVSDAPRLAFCFARGDGSGDLVGAPFPDGGLAYGASIATASLAGLDFDVDAIRPIVIVGDLTLIADLDCVEALALVEALAFVDAGFDAGGPGSALDGGVQDAGLDAFVTTDAGASDASVTEGGASADAPADGPAEADAGDASDATGEAMAPAPPPPPVPPPLRALAMPVLPAGTFTGERSFLFAAVGCLGGPAFTASIDQIVCGATYRPDSPTLRPVIVEVSRDAQPRRLGVQVLNAVATPDRMDVDSVPGQTGRPVGIVDDLVNGALRPRPPLLDFRRSDYGEPLGSSLLEVRMGNASTPNLSVTWQSVLDLGGFETLDEGRTYTLAVIGPRSGVTQGNWWNGSAITVVENDPTPLGQ